MSPGSNLGVMERTYESERTGSCKSTRRFCFWSCFRSHWRRWFFVGSTISHLALVIHWLSAMIDHPALKKLLPGEWNMSSKLGRSGPEYIPQFIVELTKENPVCQLLEVGHIRSALTAKKEVCVWGRGQNGRLGTGSSCDEAEPVLLEALESVEVLLVACGLDHTLLLVSE